MAVSVEAKEKSDKRRQFILEGSLFKVIFTIAFPQVVIMVVDSLYNMFDAYFVSGIGEAAIAAVGVNDVLVMLMRAISIGFGMGTASFISRALGANEDEKASRAAVTTLFTAAVVMAVLAVLGRIFVGPLVELMGATPEMRGYSIEYASWILLSAPITACTICLSQVLRSEGSTTYSMIGTLIGNVIDVFLNPLFITTLGLGVAGAAISTDIAKAITLVALLWPFLKRKTIIQLKPSYFTPTKEIYSEIARMGSPVTMRASLMSVSMIAINNIAASFGNAAIAAIVISNKSLMFVASAVMGFSQGFQPIAGYSWGAQKFGRVRKAFFYTLAIGGVVGIVLGAIVAGFAGPIIRIFSKDPEVMSIGLVLMWTQSATMVPHVWSMIANGMFMALGNAFRAGISGLLRQLLALLPCVLILSWLFGLNGLIWAQATSDIIACIFSAILVIPTIKQLIGLEKGRITLDKPISEAEINFDDMDIDI